ncbi:MAG: hypothetical protein CVT72_10450 [Alphaproteobacteria bacterium HGW-Alphaproteobacteria-11]|nr:MAG: hypothetical protein CVT72_10450 [Alphaproteobacteria bacterium HGW-Alphaproteobacteria-11]
MAGSGKAGQGADGEGREGGLPLWAKILAVPALLVLLYGAIVATDAVPALHPDALFASGPVIDASSLEALERSIFQIVAALPEEEQEEFVTIFTYVSWKGVDHAKGEKPDYMAQFAPWHGYTGPRLVARHRAAHRAEVAAIDAANARSAEAARLANVERGRGEVRRLEAEIAREPEIRAMLDKVDLAVTRFSAHRERTGKPLPAHMAQFMKSYVDADIVLTNRTGLNLGLVEVVFESFDRDDPSRQSRERWHFDFNDLMDDEDFEYLRIAIGGKGGFSSGQVRPFRLRELFYKTGYYHGAPPSSAQLTNGMRLNARVVTLKDTSGRTIYSEDAVDKARHELEEWQTYLDRGY